MSMASFENEKPIQTAGEPANLLANPSEAFTSFEYWFFSPQSQASMARARCDIPYTLVTALSGEERTVAKKQILQSLSETNAYCYFYINACRALEDKDAVPVLKKLSMELTQRPMEKKACLETLYVLTHNFWYWMQSKLIRPSVW